MDSWIILTIISFLSLGISFPLLKLLASQPSKGKLPPGPPTLPFIGSALWLNKSLFDIEPILRTLREKFGPIVTLHVGSRPVVFITDRRLAHQALVQKGAAFADRPPPLPHDRLLGSNQHNISSAGYSPLWRVLRRNLAGEMLSPARVRVFSGDRSWVLGLLLDRLRDQAGDAGDGVVGVLDCFHYTMFSLLVLMCFGERLEESVIGDIEDVHRTLLTAFKKFGVFGFLPKITKILFRNRWNELLGLRRRQEEIFLPLIRAVADKTKHGSAGRCSYSYVESLLGVRIPEEGGRGPTEGEIVSLCSEFLAGGTDTTATVLQWIMARLVKHQDIQQKLSEEIGSVVGTEAEEVKEADLHRMPYLKSVVMEGLRRHSPAHFVLPHAVTEEVSIGGYVIPKNASVNFMVVDMNRDGEVWAEPMEFRPERFMVGGEGEGVDITGSREIKMMPFGVGRRICPGLGLALLHLEYFVANLVREFEWKQVEGEEVDLTETLEFTVVMKNPLRARISARLNK